MLTEDDQGILTREQGLNGSRVLRVRLFIPVLFVLSAAITGNAPVALMQGRSAVMIIGKQGTLCTGAAIAHYLKENLAAAATLFQSTAATANSVAAAQRAANAQLPRRQT